MSEALILWIFGVVMAVGGGWLAWLTNSHAAIAKAQAEAAHQIGRLEIVLVMISEQAAKILHKDDDDYGLDHYIDKYLDRYYELSDKEWDELLHRFESVMNDKSQSEGARLNASFVYHICRHKLMLPPDKTKVIKPRN